MKLVAISDTHLYRPLIPDGDILIHAGDICAYGSEGEFKSEILWLSRHKHKYKIYVPGNHDRWVERYEEEAWEFCAKVGIDMLVDTFAVIRDIRFYGCPHTPVFMNWAYMQDDNQRFQHWAKPPMTDVLITHGPPYGVFDSCPLPAGCSYLKDAVQRIKPELHVIGHIHEGFGGTDCTNGIMTANVCVLDGHYQRVNTPIFTYQFQEQ